MKRLAAILVFSFFINSLSGQNKGLIVDSLKKEVFVHILQDDGILLTEQDKSCTNNYLWNITYGITNHDYSALKKVEKRQRLELITNCVWLYYQACRKPIH
jgi:hypothetical protein